MPWAAVEAGGVRAMFREHVRHLHHRIDDQPVILRLAITLGAVLSLPLFATGARALSATFGLGRLALSLLVHAHVPALVALIAVWPLGCDVCRPEGSA
ncbi:MAG: hypothetical protein ABEJ35_04320 [Halobacteriaceae archaeon]